MATAAAEIAALPAGGLSYEPRSLWDVQSVELTAQKQVLRLNRENFFNGGRYPITIERIALCGVNYAYTHTPPGAAPVVWQSTGAILHGAKIKLAPPFRQHYIKYFMPLASFPLIPTGSGPIPRGADADHLPSSLFGVCGLRFNPPLIIQRGGMLVWDISSANNYQDAVPLEVYAHMLWEEQGGRFGGSARSFGPFRVQELATLGRFPAGLVPPSPFEGWPYVIDAFADPADAGNTSDFWHPSGSFNGKLFMQQEATRAGSTRVNWMRVHLEQIAMDDALGDTVIGAGSRVAQAAMRIGCRARNVAGSDNDFWRPGAPLALVLDTITPANVYKLPLPVTLAPGDTFEVELELPGVADLSEDPLERMMNVGISLNGFAAIQA